MALDCLEPAQKQMKNIAKELFSLILYIWFRLTHRLPQVSSIYFHDPYPKLFETILKWYKKHHYRLISLAELEGLLESRQRPRSMSRSSVLTTVLTNLTDESLREELAESKRQLEDLTGKMVDVFSYPNGDVGQREVDALKEAGYRYAFTTEARDFDTEHCNPYLLPRRSMNTNGGKWDNLAKLTGIWYRIAR